METEEAVLQLVADIRDWLATSPKKEDVIAYIRALPEEQFETTRYASLLFLDEIFENLHLAWKNYAINVGEVLNPIDELELLSSLALYNTQSVFTTFQKRFPQLAIHANFPDLHSFAREFQSRWVAANALLTAPSYLRRLVDVHTLVDRAESIEQLEAIKKVFNEVYKQDDRAAKEQREPSIQENEAQKAMLSGLKIFPPEYIDTLLDPLHYAEKAELLTSFLIGIEAITMGGIDEIKKSPAKIDDIVWNIAYDRQVVDSLVYLEKNFRKSTAEQWNILDWLTTNFTIRKIQSGAFTTALPIFLNQIGAEKRSVFAQEFKSFLSFSPVFEAITEPLNIKGMFEQIDQNKLNSARVTDIILTAANDITDAESRAQAVLVFNLYYKLIRS